MAFPGKRTRTKRAQKAKNLGRANKRTRDNKGSTPSIPLTGPIPTTRAGLIVADDKVVVPQTA